jgi:hypothetical protein
MAAAMALDDGLAAAAFPSSPCAAAAARPMQDGPAWSTMSATQSAVSCSPTIGPDGESSIFPVPWVPERATVHCREPLVYTIDDFLSAREAEHFRTLAAPRLRRATVAADSHSDERRSFSENRTNRVTWLQRPDDTLRWVAKGRGRAAAGVASSAHLLLTASGAVWCGHHGGNAGRWSSGCATCFKSPWTTPSTSRSSTTRRARCAQAGRRINSRGTARCDDRQTEPRQLPPHPLTSSCWLLPASCGCWWAHGRRLDGDVTHTPGTGRW